MSLANCGVVLVGTQFPGNIGAVARSMRNFGLEDLALVRPECDPLSDQARQMSTQGEAILRQARRVDTLEAAVADCVLVVGTTARLGGPFRGQNVSPPREVMPLLSATLSQDKKAALVFGPERTGLTNEQITACAHLVQIPAAPDYPALNLAQAAAICLYELHTACVAPHHPVTADWREAAEFQEHDRMFRSLQDALERIHFLYGDKATALMHALRQMLLRARPTHTEVQILLGLARQIRWYVDSLGQASITKE